MDEPDMAIPLTLQIHPGSINWRRFAMHAVARRWGVWQPEGHEKLQYRPCFTGWYGLMFTGLLRYQNK